MFAAHDAEVPYTPTLEPEEERWGAFLASPESDDSLRLAKRRSVTT